MRNGILNVLYAAILLACWSFTLAVSITMKNDALVAHVVVWIVVTLVCSVAALVVWKTGTTWLRIVFYLFAVNILVNIVSTLSAWGSTISVITYVAAFLSILAAPVFLIYALISLRREQANRRLS
jgi:hypothetical protein